MTLMFMTAEVWAALRDNIGAIAERPILVK